jgi:hypothetical protein
MSNFGGVVTFDVKAGKWAAFETLNRLKLIDISNNLGDAKSMVTHPATTTHMRSAPRSGPSSASATAPVRISVGLEDVDDIIADLVQALGLSRVAGAHALAGQRRLGREDPRPSLRAGLGDGSLRSRRSRATSRRTPISSTPSPAPMPSAWRTAPRATTCSASPS